jgi:hypothetical protein
MQDLSYHLFAHISHLTLIQMLKRLALKNISVFEVKSHPRCLSSSIFSRPAMNRLCRSKTRMRNVTLSPFTSFNSWKHSVGFFSFTENFSLIALPDFHPSHKSDRTTQHGHTQTKVVRGKPTDMDRRVQSCSIRETLGLITFHSLPTPTSFPGRVRAIPLFYSRISYIFTNQNFCFISCILLIP